MELSPWPIFRKQSEPHDGITRLPEPPRWRSFVAPSSVTRGATYQASDEEVAVVNAALFLRRPLLITGKPGVGKSSLAHAVAYQLQLGPVLEWRITTRSTLTEGLYSYDAVGRIEQVNLYRAERSKAAVPDIGDYLRLGPLGTALYPREQPRVLLVDEIDKSDIDLPNNLLHVFEDGWFEIPELVRIARKQPKVMVLGSDGQVLEIEDGRVRCSAFPFVIFTSNGEREFPPAFLRRCLRLTVQQPPNREALLRIVRAHFDGQEELLDRAAPVVDAFLALRDGEEKRELSTDQLLNAVYLVTQNIDPLSQAELEQAVLGSLSR